MNSYLNVSLFPEQTWQISSSPSLSYHERLNSLVKDIFSQAVWLGGCILVVFPFLQKGNGSILAAVSLRVLSFSAICLLFCHFIHKFQPDGEIVGDDYDKETESQFYVLGRFPLAYFHSTTVSVLVHELGHLLAAQALFVRANAKIFLNLNKPSWTSWSSARLSYLGEKLGFVGSFSIVLVSGAALQTAVDIGLIIAGHRVMKSKPHLSTHLQLTGTLGILNTVSYVLMGLHADLPRFADGDFARLWKIAGIHPLAMAALITGIALGTKMVLIARDNEANKIQSDRLT